MQGLNFTWPFCSWVFFSISMGVLFKSIVNGFMVSRNVDTVSTNVYFFCVCARDFFVSQRTRDRNCGLSVSIRSASHRSWLFRVVRDMSRNASFISNPFLLITIVNFAPFNLWLRTFLCSIFNSQEVLVIEVYVTRFIGIVPFKLRFFSFRYYRVAAWVGVVNVVAIGHGTGLAKRGNLRVFTRA